MALSSTGVSLTPVDAQGAPLNGSEGALDGATVFYGETGIDADTVLKPTTLGFEADTMLRAIDSPQQLYFRVGLPAGATLVQARDGSGAEEIVKEGVALATVLPPSARDAAGTAVPVSMSVAGDVLTLSVEDRSGEYQFPVEVDPTFIEDQLGTSGAMRTNWQFHAGKGGVFKERMESSVLETKAEGAAYSAGEIAYWGYQTQGDSDIYQVTTKTWAHNPSAHIESLLELQYGEAEKGITEKKVLLSNETEKTQEYEGKATTLCPSTTNECLPLSGHEHNAVHFQQSATASCSGCSFSDSIREQGLVYLAEPSGTHSTSSFNKSSEHIEVEVENEKHEKVKQDRANVLYGSAAWWTKSAGALEAIAEDPGIGVSATKLEYENPTGQWEPVFEHNYLENEDACTGVQCYPKHTEVSTLPTKLPNGEDKIRYTAREAMSGTESLTTEGKATVKVDTAKPHSLFLGGLPYGNELSERTYKLTAYATDGAGSTVASPGVASIEVEVENREGKEEKLARKGGTGECSVSKGECTASVEYELSGAEIGAGRHSIVIVAKDKAGNEAREEEHITVRHSTPVALGPGSVDLESGDFSLEASDVSLGSGLTVSRDSSSRNVTEGDLGPDNGPLGPEWSMSLGTTESLVEIADDSMLLTDSTGKQTIFAKTKTTTYESPPGDSNLKLTVEENKGKTEKVAFYLEEPAAKTKVKFTLPSGSKLWLPTIQEGAVATDAVSYSYTTVTQASQFPLAGESEPRAVIAGPGGDVWFSQATQAGIAKITPAGQVTEYKLPTSGSGGIDELAKGPEENIWFVNAGASTFGNITPTGTVSEHKLPSGSYPEGIATGPDGNMWVTEYDKNKIVKITPSTGTIAGEYELPSGSDPGVIVAGPEKQDLWFLEIGTKKIGKIPTSGSPISEYKVEHGISSLTAITAGPDGNVWLTGNETATNGEVAKVTTSGAITYYVGLDNVHGITSGPDGDMWITQEYEGVSQVVKMNTSGEGRGTYTVPSKSEPLGIVAGADTNLWYSEKRDGKIGTITTSGTHPTITAPSEVLAAAPVGVSCSPTMSLGCRALKFTYAKATSASGEGEGEWGEYEGHLSKVSLDAYNPASGHEKMEETAVAEYSYDKLGRLRAEWDPRIESSTACGKTCSALKTTYGYDSEDDVTALDPPGQEPWSFTYGSIAGDAGSGRLLKVTRAPASTGLWKGGVLENTEVPKITGVPTESVRLAVSNGTWSGSPMSYGYQWEDCNAEGKECTPILGATNANYTVRTGDIGHTLVAEVTATNGGGSGVATSAATAEAKTQATEYALAAESTPRGISAGPEKENDLWFTMEGTNKIGEISTSGSIAAEYTLPVEKSRPLDITAGPEKEKALWFTEGTNHEIGKITTSGTLSQYELPVGSSPEGIAAAPKEKALWFTELGGGKIGKITTAGSIKAEYSVATGVKPGPIVVGPDGNLWFTEAGGKFAIGKMSPTTGEILGEYTTSDPPSSVAVGPDGNLWFTIPSDTPSKNKIGKVTTSGTVTEYSLPGSGELRPRTIVAGPEGNLWFTEEGGFSGGKRIGRITTSGVVTEIPVSSEDYPYGIATGPDGNIWFTSVGSKGNEIGKINPSPTEGEAKSPGPGSTIDYNVPLEGSAAPVEMGVNAETHEPEPEQWGQHDDPVEATAIFPPDSPQGWPASSYKRATVYYLDEEGRAVNVSRPSTSEYGNVSTTEYNEENDVTRTLSADNRATALAAGKANSAKVATLLSTFNTYKDKCSRESEFNEERESSEFGTRLCETEGPQHTVKYVEGKEQKEGLARNHVRYFYDEKVPSEGPEKEKFSEQTFNLLSETQNLTEITNSEGKVEEELEPRTTVTSYSGQSNLGWKLRAPTSVVSAAELGGAKVEHKTLYVESGEAKGEIQETRGPKGLSGESAHDSRIVYYTAEENKEGYAGCGKHPEWAGLVCVTAPVKQPAETAGVSRLPITTTIAYNMWNEPEKIEETFEKTATMPEAKRTKVETYDPAERLVTSETTSTSTKDTALPKVTDEYSASTGVLEKQSTTVSEKTKTIASKDNTLGQLSEYTDADGNVAKYKYATPEGDDLLEETSDSSDQGESSQKYKYNATTKEMTELVDSAAGVFTAGYDAEGKLTSEGYPNGMCANDSYNAVGEPVDIEYVKSANCSEKGAGVWFSESRVASVRGETMSRSSTLASETYGFDTLGRPIETQETPVGEYCKTRVYEYEAESNRTKLTKYEPNTKKECGTEGGTVEEHKYDEANRLIDSGMEYDPLGNMTKLPAADAEGHELKSTFYVDNAVATQEQNGTKNEYFLDPDGRVLETVTGAKKVISHYDGPGEAVAWTCEVSSSTKECEAGTYTRNIPGIGGALAAVQTNSSGVPVLQLHDLEGDIVATIKDKTGETKLESTYNSTEFGVPNAGKTPPPFAWLGADDVQTSLSSGVVTYGATSYVPQTARALQSEGVEPPGLPGGSGAGTPYTAQEEAWNMRGAERVGAEAPGREAGREKEAFEAALAARGEEEFGDPMRCYVGGRADEIGDKAVLSGVGGCHQGLPAGTWIYVCLAMRPEVGPPKTAAGCNHIEVKGHTSRYWAIGDGEVEHCTENETAVALVEFYVPGGKVLYAAAENAGECTGNSDQEDEAALSLFGTDDDLDAVKGVLEFFEALGF